MSDFIVVGFDYVDFIKNEEDMKLFERLKEIEPQLNKPAKECLNLIIEFDKIDHQLRRLKPRKIIILGDPKMN